jgi:hypothetical protein
MGLAEMVSAIIYEVDFLRFSSGFWPGGIRIRLWRLRIRRS